MQRSFVFAVILPAIAPYFADWHSFWKMGGHGIYVWTCWGVVLLCVGLGVLYCKNERKRAWRRLHRAARIKESRAQNR